MPNPAPKPTIAIDVDEVLASFAESFVKFSNQRWGTDLKPEDWDEHWSDLWGIDHSETDQRAKEIYKSDVFRTTEHIRGAEPVLKELAKNYRLIILTSRHRAVTKDTLDWVKEKFGTLFEDVHFAGIYDDMEKNMLERLKATKAEICKQIGASYLIDDNPKHCLAAAGAGIKSILFGDYRWNRDVELVPNMVRAKNWQEVGAFFDAEN